jgi:hypothetical protein
MKTEAIKNWSGSVAIAWMMSIYVLIHYVIVPHQIIIGPFWVWIFTTLAIQLVPGLAFAIAGMRCGNRVGRVSAVLAAVLFLWFVWYGLVPVLLTIRALGVK